MVNEIGYDSIEALSVSSSNTDGTWIINLRCTFHMTPYRGSLYDYKDMNIGILHMKNNHTCNVTGVGSVRLHHNYSSTYLMKNVRYVLTLKKNLIPWSTLENTW